MNRHFEDAKYYLNRAAETGKKGLREELGPVEDRFRELTGREKEPEPTRLEKLQQDITEMEKNAEGEARRALTSARSRIEEYRRDN